MPQTRSPIRAALTLGRAGGVSMGRQQASKLLNNNTFAALSSNA